jgi:peptidoglycan L-alanyl-D-glutamate endopeptidase CwlK
MFKALFNAILAMQQKNAGKHFISKHLSRVALYELRGREALLPDLKTKFEQLEEQMKNYTINDSYEIELVESFRTAKTQDGYYAKGRTKDGNIITNAEGLESYHQYALAFDIKFKHYGWSPPAGYWDVLGEKGESLGLEWGGRWQSRDVGHFQYRPGGATWEKLKPYFQL